MTFVVNEQKRGSRAKDAPHSDLRAAGKLPPIKMALLLPLASAVGCAPIVDVLGVYFPGWLVSTVVGAVIAYALVWGIGYARAGRELAQSGLFFVSSLVASALAVWWICFRDF